MQLDEFDYVIPTGYIAQAPAPARDESRLMVLNKELGEIQHALFKDITQYLRSEDVLVLNNTKVMNMRFKAVRESGANLAPEEYLPGSFFEKGERGVFWLVAQQRGEGLNLADFAASKYGPAFTIETGMTMKGGFEERVDTSVLAAKRAIATFEERYV